VLARAFSGLGLHRVEANVQPGNTASLRLILACGFRCEGYSPRLVYIDSRWRDHVRFAIDLRDWRARPGAAARPAPAVKPKKRRGPLKGPR
jgi:ribosomal-protein-alanine N-acetyltransferase